MNESLEKLLSWKPMGAKKSRRRSGRSSRRDEDFEVDPCTGSRRPVARRELFIAICAGVNLVCLPWFLSGVPYWAQWFSFVMACAAFAFLFLPVGYDDWRSRSARDSFKSLMRSAPFWIGVLLFAYFTVQGLNTRAVVELDRGSWQIIPLDHISWLPTSVEAPAEAEGLGGMNTWRTMLIFGAPFLTFIALWVGVRSRRLVVGLTRVLVASVTIMGLYAVSLRAAGEKYVFNSVPVSIGSVFGPFTYQNQAGAFFYAAFLLATALGIREWRKAGYRFARGGAHYVIGAAACLIGFASVFSASFAASAVMAVALFLALVTLILARPRTEGGSRIMTWTVLGAVVLTFAYIFLSTDWEPVWNKLMAKMNLAKMNTVDDRRPLREATMMMYRDMSPLYGSGAGTYRWVMIPYFAKFPEFCSPTTGRLLSRALYAHCDWAQMLAEWGAIGVALVGAGFVWFLNSLRRWKVWLFPAIWPLLGALGFLVAHAAMDFLFFNPAVLLLFAFIAYVTLSWARDSWNARMNR